MSAPILEDVLGDTNPFDSEYARLVREALLAEPEMDRTGIGASSAFGGFFKAKLDEQSFMTTDGPVDYAGFPALTLKRLAWKSVVGELLGFMRGYDNAEQFRRLGCAIWDQNANENSAWLNNPSRKGVDDLGRIYGVQWRRWIGVQYRPTDQLLYMIHTLRHNPSSRRNIVSAWNPQELNYMALPPCHVMFQVRAYGKKLHLHMYQRSADLLLGVPFNIASYSLLTHLLAGVTGLEACSLSISFGDYHVYSNHVEGATEMLGRAPMNPPVLKIHWPSEDAEERLNWLLAEDGAKPEDFTLVGYYTHPSIPLPMAV